MDLANARRRLRVDNMSYHESNARHSKRRWMRLTTDLILWSSVLRTVSAMRLSFAHSFQVNNPLRNKPLDHLEKKPVTSDLCLSLPLTSSFHRDITIYAVLFDMRNTNCFSLFLVLWNATQACQAAAMLSRCILAIMPLRLCLSMR